MTQPAALLDSLAIASARGDPAARAYALLFARSPAFEPMFVLDRDGGVRAAMAAQSFEIVLEWAEGRGAAAAALLAAVRSNHDGYGLPPGAFDLWLPILAEAVRDLAGPAWTAAMQAVWNDLLADLVRPPG